jgi:hypothetical protein
LMPMRGAGYCVRAQEPASDGAFRLTTGSRRRSCLFP